MKTSENIKELFPIKIKVTQKIIDEATITNTTNCIGALTLKSKFPNQEYISWGRTFGHMQIDNEIFTVKTLENIDMMEITEPTEATFYIQAL